jgi:hypothetical protein
VALAYDNEHFEVDDNKSKKLPNNTGSKKLHKSRRYHCGEVLIIRLDGLFYSLHEITP